ncbi:hypothetical protein HRI_004833000 [Hibiscus trionum]|uniref:Uncharacterized protein n=1 Tax=Hibiscus trionum TaxID=183268 RepID=A0A9W7JF22_HIBTR|nr:hypothetical protein HRI_004833000 [Hibiscus trionum]
MAKQPYLKKRTWTPDEDRKLIAYIMRYGIWNWNEIPKFAGLQRSGKSCRLRWMNYLRPNIRRGNFTREEEETISSATTETSSSVEENSCDADSSTLLNIPAMADFPEAVAYSTAFSPSGCHQTAEVDDTYSMSEQFVSSENFWEMQSFLEQPLMTEGFDYQQFYDPVDDFWVNPLV